MKLLVVELPCLKGYRCCRRHVELTSPDPWPGAGVTCSDLAKGLGDRGFPRETYSLMKIEVSVVQDFLVLGLSTLL